MGPVDRADAGRHSDARRPYAERRRLADVFLAAEGVRRWQIRQTAPDAVQMLVVPGRTWSDGARAGLLERMQKRIGDRMRVELHLVDEITTTAAGKFQTIMPLSATREAAVLSAISSRPEPEALPRRKTA